MKPIQTLLIFLLFISTANCQEIYTEKMSGSTTSPGILTTVTRNFPNSPIDGYNLYVPTSSFDADQPYPILVFLQGGKGVGGPVDRVLQWALPQAILSSDNLNTELDKMLRDTFIVIAPHIRNGEFYEGEAAMRQIISEVLEKENADPDRIYLTGLSRGGYGTWGLASRMTDVFSAAAPICGGGRGINDYEALSEIPLWIAHNTGRDSEYRRSKEIVDRLERDQGVSFVRTSTLEDVNPESDDRIFTSPKVDHHDAWTDFYNHVDFYRWLLRFSK